MYNERPTCLANAHAELDAAVAAAYGWPADISEEDALLRLFQLNQERGATCRSGAGLSAGGEAAEEFVEQGSFGDKKGRTAYAFSEEHLPEPLGGLAWQSITEFKPADELLADGGLKELFKQAIESGCAVIASKHQRAWRPSFRPLGR